MASEKPAPGEAHENADQSIKARKFQLFETEKSSAGTVKARTFAEYVKDSPAAPMSRGVKAALCAVAVIVALLFLAAIFGGRSRGSKPRQTENPNLAPVVVMLEDRALPPNR